MCESHLKLSNDHGLCDNDDPIVLLVVKQVLDSSVRLQNLIHNLSTQCYGKTILKSLTVFYQHNGKAKDASSNFKASQILEISLVLILK